MIKQRAVIIVLVICSAAFLFPVSAYAADTPSNEELYQMILELKDKQEHLQREVAEANAEAEKARRELETTRQVLDATQEDLKAAEAQITRTGEAVVQTQEGLTRTQAEMGTQPSSSVVRIPETVTGGFVNAGVLVLRPENDRLAYAVVDEDTPPANTILRTVRIDTGYEPGFRIGGGYRFGNGREGFFRLSWLDASARDSVTDPVGNADLSCVFCNDQLVNTFEDELDSATAKYELNYRVVDAGFTQDLSVSDRLNLRLGGGLRYASIADEINAFYSAFGGGANVGFARIENELWGIGPRATLDVAWNQPGGFSMFGSAGGSLLVGDNDFLYDIRGNVDILSIRSNGETRVLPVLEATLGASYTGAMQHMQYDVSLGYEFETWINALSQGAFNEVSGENRQFVREDTDLSLHGIFLQGRVNW